MTSARDLEEYFLLTFEDDLAVIGAAREEHEPIEADQLVVGECAWSARCIEHAGSIFRYYGLRHPILTDGLIVLR